MGMLDMNGKFDIDRSVTAVGDTVSTNVYDSGSAPSSDIGANNELWLNATVSTNATSGGAATLQAVLQHSDDNSVWSDAMEGFPLPVAQLKIGAILMKTQVPIGLKRYTRIAWRVGTAALTAGKFSAYFSKDVQHNVHRPSGFTVV